MIEQEVKAILLQELPDLLEHDPQVRESIWRLLMPYYAPRQETESRFDRVLSEIQHMREESEHKWEEQKRKWDENQAELRQMREESERKWRENQSTINQVLAEIKRLDTKITTKIGAIGARWGKSSEDSFRNALRGILGKTFGVQVINLNELDDTGVVFGRPEFVELDLIIRNGMLLICEIKSSISKADVYAFERKARFYEQRHQCQATQLIIISPMIDGRAQLVIQQLGIQAYDDAEDVGLDDGIA
jgi:hypothetical protein